MTDRKWCVLCRIAAYPDLEFLVIVNPNSGPGALPCPDANYAREVARLNACPNVYPVGYIRIDYCRKPLAAACEEIDRYASWAAEYATTGLGVGGIMVDETPNHFNAAQAEYLRALHRHIKNCSGLLRDRLVSIMLFFLIMSVIIIIIMVVFSLVQPLPLSLSFSSFSTLVEGMKNKRKI